MGALLVAAGLGPTMEHALISLLALNGQRVSEATGASIEDMAIERGTGAALSREALLASFDDIVAGGPGGRTG